MNIKCVRRQQTSAKAGQPNPPLKVTSRYQDLSQNISIIASHKADSYKHRHFFT